MRTDHLPPLEKALEILDANCPESCEDALSRVHYSIREMTAQIVFLREVMGQIADAPDVPKQIRVKARTLAGRG